MFSCSGNKKEIKDDKCLPATILIVYLGEDNKPTYPLVIRTKGNDTSFLTFMGSEREKLEKNGFVISKEYFRIYTIKPAESYFLLKQYIVEHNTHKERTVFNAEANTMKIILYDKCDSLSYAVNKEEKRYFSKMIDTLNLKSGDELWDYIHYYHEIQNWDGNR